MMNFTEILANYFVLVVVLACLVVGYIIKTLEFIPNKYIPTILAVLGAILNLFISGFSIESFVFGAFMGLASTGLHQTFKNFIENKKEGE